MFANGSKGFWICLAYNCKWHTEPKPIISSLEARVQALEEVVAFLHTYVESKQTHDIHNHPYPQC